MSTCVAAYVNPLAASGVAGLTLRYLAACKLAGVEQRDSVPARGHKWVGWENLLQGGGGEEGAEIGVPRRGRISNVRAPLGRF